MTTNKINVDGLLERFYMGQMVDIGQKKGAGTGGGWKTAVLIALGITGIYLLMATRSTLWDRDEPRFTRATVEMVESGNYLVPSFNGEVWADKPVFVYWVMSVAMRLLGPTELAFRFFGAVGTGLTCLLTFFIGKRLLGVKAGLWAMVIPASTLLILAVGGAATSDAILLPFAVGALAVFIEVRDGKVSPFHIILLGAALGIGMLAKGPMGLMPVFVIISALLLGRRFELDFKLRFRQVGIALLLGGLIFSAWAIPANNATNGEFLRVFVGRHVINRAFRPMEHHGGNFLLYLPYYLPVVIIGFFPWSLHLPGAFSAVLGGRVGGKYGRIFLLSWIVPVFIIMTLAATKLPHYIILIWPGLALAVAGTLIAEREGRLVERDKVWLRRGTWFFGPPAIGMALGLMIVPWFVDVPGLRWSGLAAGAVLAATAAIANRRQERNQPQASAKAVLVGIGILEIVVMFGVLPAVEQVKIAPAIAQAVNARTSKDVPVATYKYREPTLNFYVGRHIEPLGSEEAVAVWAKQAGAGVLIIPASNLNEIEERYGVLPLEKVASKKGINYSKGKMLEVVALVRKADQK